MKISYIIVLTAILAISFSPSLDAQEKENFTNPILAGFYPDPSICKVGKDFYLVNSSFAYYPGIPIFHSTDLVSWNLLGHVMDRPEQLPLEGHGVSRGLFAPAIRYHDGIYYVTCTMVDVGGNFVVTSKEPSGPWSNPVWLPQVHGIDPSLFFDDDGKAYIIYNSDAPDNKPVYSGHRTIRMYQFDFEKLQVKGEELILINRGTKPETKPIWIEGPHILRKNDYYYLIAAEGGTAENHSEVVFRSKKVGGPYESFENNPILTQRHLNPDRKNPITSTGHADFVELDNGDWWSTFLGCRPYADDHYNTGRETFLAPVKWQNGWPIINPDFEEVQYRYPKPHASPGQTAGWPMSDNFSLKDDFTDAALNPAWTFLRTVRYPWFHLDQRAGYLAMDVRPETCSGKANPSFIGRRQQHLKGSASVALDFTPTRQHEKAGLLVFQGSHHYYFICKSLENGQPVVQLFKSTDQEQMELMASQTLNPEISTPLRLRIESDADNYSFYYSGNDQDWQPLMREVDARFLSTKVAGGFVGCFYAMYATSLGRASHAQAFFDWFEYIGDDLVYK